MSYGKLSYIYIWWTFKVSTVIRFWVKQKKTYSILSKSNFTASKYDVRHKKNTCVPMSVPIHTIEVNTQMNINFDKVKLFYINIQ